MTYAKQKPELKLVISIGANIPGILGDPIRTIAAMRPEIEKSAGRKRENTEIAWGPRSLDIDFISWGGLQVNTETLILPHPRFSERNFVLIPLSEVLSKTQGQPKRLKSQKIWPEQNS